MNRVVVTGVGCVSPLATNALSTWQMLLAGASGISKRPANQYGGWQLMGSINDTSAKEMLLEQDSNFHRQVPDAHRIPHIFFNTL